MIPFKRINLGNALERIKPLLESGMIGLGDEVFKFEQALAEYVGAKYVVATDSCTSALFLSMRWHLKQGGRNRVSIPSMTVPLVACAAIEAGMYVRFNSQTEWVGSHYPLVGTDIIDSAHELRRDQIKTMTEAFMDEAKKNLKVCFSFYPTKTIGSADGGAIATNDEEFAEWARQISTYGRNQRQKYANSWDYDVTMIGYKRHWTNLQAVVALEQMERLDDTNAKRKSVVERYNAAFGLKNDSDYLYRLNVSDQKAFIDFMAKNGVECGVHFKPLHLMAPFRKFSTENRPKIEDAYKKTVSIPLYDTLTDTEVDTIIKLVKESGGLTV